MTATRRERLIIYVLVGAVVLILMVLGAVSWRNAKADEEAQRKADQFIAALTAAGANAPPQEQIVRVLGSDGGAICTDPNESLIRANLQAQLSNGAGGPGTRSVIADHRAVEGGILVISIYCPDRLPEFKTFVEGLKTADLTGE
jgi:Tfp pilus assembly protein FimT